MSRLFAGEKSVRVVTTNYKKDGTKFRNFLTLAPLKDEVTGKVTHFVAILNDVGDIYRRRKIRQDNEKILREAMDDITVGSDVSIPTTLAEALPTDIEKRNNDPRAIVVTEASGSFNMIGCNKAWEVRLLATDLQWRCSYYIQSITSKCIFLKESLWIYRV